MFVPGCPKPGYYDENCSIQCPNNCLEHLCDIVEGTCLNCVEGYTGPMCSEGKRCDQVFTFDAGDQVLSIFTFPFYLIFAFLSVTMIQPTVKR